MSPCLCGAIDCPSCAGPGGYDPTPACARCDDTGVISVLAGGDPDREEECWCPDCGDQGADEEPPDEAQVRAERAYRDLDRGEL